MPCDCSNFHPIELDRRNINRRIRESAAIKRDLSRLADNVELRIALYRCSTCGQLWQSGYFGGESYLFQVPAIDVADWLLEPYVQPAAMMIYSAVMRDYSTKNNFETSDSGCKADGCHNNATRLSAFCHGHHIESLQETGLLPRKPVGKLFPPYYNGDGGGGGGTGSGGPAPGSELEMGSAPARDDPGTGA